MMQFSTLFGPRPANSKAAYVPSALLTLVLALSGCVTTGLDKAASPSSPFVVYSAVGNQPLQQAQRFEDDERASDMRRRSLPAINTRSAAKANSVTAAQDNQPTTMLSFSEADLEGVVRAMAQFTGRNFVVDPRVRGQLTLMSQSPVDAQTAYSMLLGALRMQGFAVVDVDGVSRVLPEADAKLWGGPVLPSGQSAGGGELITRVFSLKYENASDLVPILRPMVAPANTLVAHAGNNALVITDYADNLERIASVIESIDTPMAVNTDVIPIEYGVALDVAALAQQMLQTNSGKKDQSVMIVADPRSNVVLVRAGTPERLKLARDLILRIDSPESKAGNLHVVYLRNAQATHLAEVLRGALTGEGGAVQSQAVSMSNTAPASGDVLAAVGAMPGTASMDASQAAAPSPSTGVDAQMVAFSAAGATVQADPTTNTLIISAPAPLYRSLREIIDLLDQRRAQVLIESMIVEVNSDNAAELGVQWMVGADNVGKDGSGFVGGANLGGTGIGLNRGGGYTTIDALARGLSLGVVKGTVNVMGQQLLNLGVLANAMQRHGGANILSTPNLMTLDNEQASIIVGRTVPFVTGTYTTTGDGASNPFQTVQREDVGLTLRIRPQISEGGSVKLSLYQEVSSIDPGSTTNSIITRKRALETNVLVDDGQIIVLGGLLEDMQDDSTTSVPLLGDIPVLGNLFKYQKRSHSKTNLMLFLRPHIVRTPQDSAGLTLDRYNYMRLAQSGLPARDSWLLPDGQATILPEMQRDADTGLLDVRSGPRPASYRPARISGEDVEQVAP